MQDQLFCLHYRTADYDLFDIQEVDHGRDRGTDVGSGPAKHHLSEIVLIFGRGDNIGERNGLFGKFV